MKTYVRHELDKLVERTLKDAGFRRQPVRLPELLEHLELYQEFYNLSDPGFLDKTKHKVTVGGRKLTKIIKTIKLQAVLFFDENRVVIDSSLPSLKQAWPGFHEAGHRICPWHRDVFAFGDTAQTLAPDFQEKLEAEANYAGAGLMFGGRLFTEMARDTTPCWASVRTLSNDFDRTMTTTLRRYVGFGPDCAMAMTISTPHWAVGGEHEPGDCRHYIVSPSFEDRFGHVKEDELMGQLNFHSSQRTGGSVADFTFPIPDSNGDHHEFRAEGFFNTHDLLTLFVEQKRLDTQGPVIIPQPIPVQF